MGEEKRTLLFRVQSAEERCRKLQRELDCTMAKQSEKYGKTENPRSQSLEQSNDVSSTEEEGLEWQLNEGMQANRKWKDSCDRLQEKHEEESKRNKEELQKTQAKLADAETHVLA